MAAYTVLNLKQVEDAAVKHGQTGMEARFARVPLGLEKSGMSYFRFDAGFRVPFGHLHHEQEELYVVLSGGLRVKVGEEIVELGPMDALRVAPGTMRGMEAGAGGVELLAFGAPNTENRDLEMEPGWWSDADEGGAAPPR
jgi:mannose-6-phosphate isomerase-like protein (cupin superfamily)